MYEFVDTIEESGAGALPSEALSINGTFLENLIDGYKTLNTNGRETFTTELTESEIGIHDGEFLSGRRYPAREITVTFQIIAEDALDFRDKFNKLNSSLNVENATLIFNDEPDKFLIGTPSGASEIEAGRNAVVGEFTIKCHDPFKYSVQEYSAELREDEGGKYLFVDYDGTMPSRPILQADFYKSDTVNDNTGRCGYVAFANDKGNVLQFGDPADTDEIEQKIEKIVSSEYIDSEKLINDNFNTLGGWPSALRNQGWTTSSTDHKQVGTAKSAVIGSGTSKAFQINSAGSGSKVWHGPSIVQQIASDSGDPVQSTHLNWRATCALRFASSTNATTAKSQRGAFQFSILDENKAYIAAIQVWRGNSNTKGKARCYVRGKGVVKEWDVDLSWYNAKFGYKKNSTDKRTNGITIKKSGAKFSFNVGGLTVSFTATAAVGEVKATYMCIYLAQYDSASIVRLGVYSCSFETDSRRINISESTYEDIVSTIEEANVFSTNDVLIADCKDASVRLTADNSDDTEGVSRPDLGALGNEWEQFVLMPGTNQIGVGYSGWVDSQHAPTFSLRYRKVYV